MPASLANIFGTAAAANTASGTVAASATDPTLIVKYSGQSTAGWDAIATGDQTNPWKWLSSFIKNAMTYYNSLSDTDKTTQNFIVQPSFSPVSLETRGTQVYRKYSYTVEIYELDTGASSFDPDKVA